MKKTLLFLLGLMILGSCAKTDSLYGDLREQNNAQQEVRFDNGFFGQGTKAIINTNADLQGYEYGVYAKVVGTPDGVTITGEDTYWIYDETLIYSSGWKLDNDKHYFWPKSADNVDDNDPALNFYSFGPRSVGNITKNGNIIEVPIAIKATEIDDNIKDLVYASTYNQTYAKNNGTDRTEAGRVNLPFEHQLAWIEFQAKTSTAFTTLTINSVTVKVNQSTATFSFTPSNAIATVADQTGSPTLTNAATAVPVTHVLNGIASTNIAPNTGYVTVGRFVALPQTVKDDMTAIINYSASIGGFTYANRTATVKLNAGTLHEEGTVDHANNTGWTITSWAAGYKYIYKINISWREILFSASVSAWNNTANSYLIY